MKKALLLCVFILSIQTIKAADTDLVTEMDTTPVINYSNTDIESILVPREIYILKSSAMKKNPYLIFKDSLALTKDKKVKVDMVGSYGYFLEDRWKLSEDILKTRNVSDKFSMDFNLSQSVTMTSTIELIDTKNTKPVRLLAIGDSLTRNGVYLREVENQLPNVTCVGSRIYKGDNVPAREGRGGWTLNKYFNAIGTSELDSPFVYPIDVTGSQYKGNTNDWYQICYKGSKDAMYSGFQNIARGWKDNGPYLYDNKGYYKNPSIGDIMVDVKRVEDSKWITWNGSEWKPMQKQPINFEFNFSKYMERYSCAFKEGGPTHVSILLGANDFGYSNTIKGLKDYIDKLNKMIDSIHTYDRNIKVIICTPTLAPSINIVNDENTGFYESYDKRMKIAIHYILKTFDNEEHVARNIYVAPMHLTLDTSRGFDYKTSRIGEVTKVSAVNSIHPNNTVGQIQMGNTLAAVIQKYR